MSTTDFVYRFILILMQSERSTNFIVSIIDNVVLSLSFDFCNHAKNPFHLILNKFCNVIKSMHVCKRDDKYQYRVNLIWDCLANLRKPDES